MPGSPSYFKDKSIIFICGKSGTGKTTLCSFLESHNKDIYTIHLDRYFINSNLKSYKSIKYDKPYEHVGTITKLLLNNSKYKDLFIEDISLYIKNYIKKILNKKNTKLILVEGYTLIYNEILDESIKKIKLEYNNMYCWIMNNQNI
jgi:uridine kinase